MAIKINNISKNYHYEKKILEKYKEPLQIVIILIHQLDVGGGIFISIDLKNIVPHYPVLQM